LDEVELRRYFGLKIVNSPSRLIAQHENAVQIYPRKNTISKVRLLLAEALRNSRKTREKKKEKKKCSGFWSHLPSRRTALPPSRLGIALGHKKQQNVIDNLSAPAKGRLLTRHQRIERFLLKELANT